MNRREFRNKEARAVVEFEDRTADFWHPENTGGHTAVSYRCDCGYTTTSSGDIHDHVTTTHGAGT